MDEQNSSGTADLVGYTSDIVGAFVANNSVSATELPGLIASVHAALTGIGQPKTVAAEKPVPHMPIKKTITPEALISLEDGKPYKTLKRHLAGRGMTPAQYREKWGLPHDYPMAAPDYSARRSELARSAGLGQQRQKSQEAKAPAPAKAKRQKAAA